MDAFLVSIQAQMFGAIAEMEGMKAQNAVHLARGEFPRYDENEFNRIAGFLNGLANDVRSSYY